MKNNVLRMIDELDAHGKTIIHFALVGMTSGLGTTAEMVDALEDRELDILHHCLRGMLE